MIREGTGNGIPCYGVAATSRGFRLVAVTRVVSMVGAALSFAARAVATNVKLYFCDPHSPWQ
jgi:hypothetical protein